MVKLRVRVPHPDPLFDVLVAAFGEPRKNRTSHAVWKDLRMDFGWWRKEKGNTYTAKTEVGRLWLLMNMPPDALILEER